MLWEIKDEPIIESRLDVDMYKFTMGQLIDTKHPQVPTVFGFKNRTTGVNLTEYISESELREQLDHMRTLRLTKSELHYLRGTNEYQDRMFREPYLEHLDKHLLPEYDLEYYKGDMRLRFPGEWAQNTYWETMALSIITELFSRAQIKNLSRIERDVILARGVKRLYEKIKILKQYPEITFSDFSTRRRAFRFWQKYVVEILKEELPGQFLGTSNVKLAMDLDLLPMGTNAHELYMVYSRLFGQRDIDIRYSLHHLWEDWWEMYGWGLSINLSDTFGSEAFLRDFSYEYAQKSKGFRHDSGDAIVYGEKVLAFYKKFGINAKEKIIVFSDGLDLETIIKIYLHFRGRIMITFGWGTNLGNDLGLQVLSLIIKIFTANGWGAVKLSDNISKGLGASRDIKRFKSIFDYTNKFKQACRY